MLHFYGSSKWERERERKEIEIGILVCNGLNSLNYCDYFYLKRVPLCFSLYLNTPSIQTRGKDGREGERERGKRGKEFKNDNVLYFLIDYKQYSNYKTPTLSYTLTLLLSPLFSSFLLNLILHSQYKIIFHSYIFFKYQLPELFICFSSCFIWIICAVPKTSCVVLWSVLEKKLQEAADKSGREATKKCYKGEGEMKAYSSMIQTRRKRQFFFLFFIHS